MAGERTSQTVWSAGELADAIHRGTRLCMMHIPMDNGDLGGKKHWVVCVARLPKEKGELIWSGRPRSFMPVIPDTGRQHFQVFIPDDVETRKWFEEVRKSGGGPTVFHQTREMIFVRLDIAKFTKYSEEIQPLVIAELHELVTEELRKKPPVEAWGVHTPERVLHTGDGFILAYAMPIGDANPWPLDLAQRIARVLDEENDERLPIHFRIAVTLGPVYETGDLLGLRNYVGDAISESDRLLSIIPKNQDDVVCFSDKVYRKYRDGLKSMKFIRMGSLADKNKKMHRLYVLEYTD